MVVHTVSSFVFSVRHPSAVSDGNIVVDVNIYFIAIFVLLKQDFQKLNFMSLFVPAMLK